MRIFAALLKTFEGRSNVTTYQTLVQQWHQWVIEVLIEVKLSTSHRGYCSPHRLCINGLDKQSDQPRDWDQQLLCNGEIYNYKELCRKYNITCKSNSDCEVLHLYKMFGIHKAAQLLDGVFAFIIFDNGQLFVETFLVFDLCLYLPRAPKTSDLRSQAKQGLRTMSDVISHTRTWATYSADNASSFWKLVYHSFLRSMIWGMWHTLTMYIKNFDFIYTRLFENDWLQQTDQLRALSGGLDSTLVCNSGQRATKPDDLLRACTPTALDLDKRPISCGHGLRNSSVPLITSVSFQKKNSWVQFHERFGIRKPWILPSELLLKPIVSEFVRDTSDQAVLLLEMFPMNCLHLSWICKAPWRRIAWSQSIYAFDIHHYDVLRSDRSIAGAGLDVGCHMETYSLSKRHETPPVFETLRFRWPHGKKYYEMLSSDIFLMTCCIDERKLVMGWAAKNEAGLISLRGMWQIYLHQET